MKVETRVGLFMLAAIGVFVYLSVNIRAFRFDKNQYYEYKAYFDDTGGVAIKAPVRIAGVDVGWLEDIRLLPGSKAELSLRIHKKIKLAKNAYATIHQEGLIGTKNIEIDPGDPATGFLLPGATLSLPGKTPTSVGEILEQFSNIAHGIQDITTSLKSVFATRQGETNMKVALNSIAKASNRLADFSETLQRTMDRNEENINAIVGDLKSSVTSLKDAIPSVTDSFKRNADIVGDTFSDVGDRVGDAADEVGDTFHEAKEVVGKINSGKGLIGKLVNDDSTYGDVKKSIHGIKSYLGKTQALMLNVDLHSETMFRHTNSKGYFELRIRPNSDFFYLVQLATSERGTFTHEIDYYTRMDEKGTVLRASELSMAPERKIEWADKVEHTIQRKYAMLFGLQFGKRFDRLTLRMGLFENTFGMGLDYYVPLNTDKLHWITTLEAFDLRGVNRLNDHRPHVKWLNRTFFMKNLYTTFGVDDVFSKNDASPFFGGGLRFGDDDLKSLLSSFPVGQLTK